MLSHSLMALNRDKSVYTNVPNTNICVIYQPLTKLRDAEAIPSRKCVPTSVENQIFTMFDFSKLEKDIGRYIHAFHSVALHKHHGNKTP